MADLGIRAALAIGAVVMGVGLNACSDVDKELFEQHRPTSQSEAGSVHLAVAPPIPFEYLRESLVPSYGLTADDAAKAALPTTGYMEDRFFQAFSAALGIGLAKTSVTGTKSDGSAPIAKAPDMKLAESGKNELSTGDDKRQPKQDPMLQYAAATALYQEVKLLEQYVNYAAQRHQYQPFIVRMNVGIQPFARNQPYDVYSSIGFFASDECETAGGKFKATPLARQPYILPLLVTDNLEGMSTAKSAEMITQVALAVSALVQGVAGEASFGLTRDRLKSVLGTDLNAIQTVSRTADNAIQVRLGAASQPTARFAMIPRNHTITVLMLVPNRQFETRCPGRPPVVRTVIRSTLRDAVNGELLLTGRDALFAKMRANLEEAGFSRQLAQALTSNPAGQHELVRLAAVVQQQQRDVFEARLMMLTSREPDPESAYAAIYRDALWLVLAEFQSRSQTQSAFVTLCDPKPTATTKDIACERVKPPPAPPAKKKEDPPKTVSGNTITTTITTTTVPPTKN
jgi:hypothetical protein